MLTAIRLGGAIRQSRQGEQKSPVSLAGLNKFGAGRPERYDHWRSYVSDHVAAN